MGKVLDEVFTGSHVSALLSDARGHAMREEKNGTVRARVV